MGTALLVILLILVIIMTVCGAIAIANDDSFWAGFFLFQFLEAMMQIIGAICEAIASSTDR